MNSRGETVAKRKKITTKLVQDTQDKPLPQVEYKPEADEDGWLENGLTIRQQRFVDALCGQAGGNASRAAELAGYSAENTNVLAATASRLLSFVNVRQAVARKLASANLTADWVRQMTAALAASNMGSFLRIEDGKPIIDWKQAESLGAFVQIRKYKEKGVEVGDTIEVIDRQIETHNPAPYLQLLSKMLGLTDDSPKTNVTVRIDNQFDYDSFARQFIDFARQRLCEGRDADTSGNGQGKPVHPE
jgi:hypothetical protein